MLRAIADFSMQGRWQAALAAAFLSAASMLFPPLNFLANGVIVLKTLRMGPVEGAKVLSTTLLVFMLLTWLLLKQLWLGGLIFLISWLPVFLVTLALGYSRSLATALLVSSGLGIATITLLHLFLPNLTGEWYEIINAFMTMFDEQYSWQLSDVETAELINSLAPMMTGLIVASVSLHAFIGLIVGRFWQSQLFNPGGFASEFRALQLGKPAAVLTALLIGLTLVPISDSPSVLVDFLPVMLIAFSIQGIAIVHALVRLSQGSKAWLVTMYLLLVLMLPYMVVILAVSGILDQWFNFRKRSLVG